MTIWNPARLDLLQRELWAVVGAAVAPAQCVWGLDEGVWETYSPDGVVSLRVLSGPGPIVRQGARGRIQQRVEFVEVEVINANTDERVGFVVNDHAYFYDVQGGDTPTNVRDALQALVDADAQYSGLTTTTSAPATLRVYPGQSEIWQFSFTPGGSLFAIQLDAEDSILVASGTQEIEIEIQAFSKGRELREGAGVLIQQALAALQSIPEAFQLRDAGVAIRGKAQPLDLSAVAGGHWESRSAVTVTFALRATWTRPVDRIETLNVAHTFANPPATASQTITVASGGS